MHNHTNCVLIIRTFHLEISQNRYQEISIQEYIFKKKISTRRYCVVFEKRNGHRVYDVTEHEASFFDKVVKAHSGWSLFDLYIREKIDPVPMKNPVSLQEKFESLKEFYVIFNCTYKESTIVSMLKNNKNQQFVKVM